MEIPNQNPTPTQPAPETRPAVNPIGPQVPAQPEVQPLHEPMPQTPQEVPRPDTGHGPH